jgi:hypothetical protein
MMGAAGRRFVHDDRSALVRQRMIMMRRDDL